MTMPETTTDREQRARECLASILSSLGYRNDAAGVRNGVLDDDETMRLMLAFADQEATQPSPLHTLGDVYAFEAGDDATTVIAKVVCLNRYGLAWKYAERQSHAELKDEAAKFLATPQPAQSPMGERVERLRELMAKATGVGFGAAERSLPWEVWTSNSFRRVKTLRGDDVLSAYAQRSDGCLDLSMPEDRLIALIDLVNELPALLDALATLTPKDATPAGMVPWAGGDQSPDDWDGGPVWCEDGALYGPPYEWSRASGGPDIIAYTPQAPPMAEEVREACAKVAECHGRIFGEDDASGDRGTIIVRRTANAIASAIRATPLPTGQGEGS